MVITVKSADKVYKGEIKTVTNNSLTIKDEKVGDKDFTEIEIEEISWERKTTNYFAFAKYIIPGVMQFQNGKKLKGLIMGTLFFGFIGGAASQYAAATKAIDSDVDYILIGNNIYVGSNLNPNPEYENHIKNMQYSLGGLGLLYAFHSYEVYSHISKSGVKTSIKINASQNYNPVISSNPNPLTSASNQSIEFNISYQF